LSTREIVKPKQVAIACQGGGSHAIFNAGVLKVLVKEQTDQRYRIMGLSGTSGGGICALLTWYALLEKGEGAVGPLLDAFWRDNAPEYPWEYLWNAWSVLAASAPLDARVSPYTPPLSWVEAGLELWSPRKEFVDLRYLLEKHVRFAEIEKIGAFLQIDEDIARWRTANEWQSLGLHYAEADAPKLRSKEIARLVDQLPRLGFAQGGELEKLSGLLASAEDEIVDGHRMSEIGRAVHEIAKKVPLLLLGAVDALSGEFKAFSSRKGEINADAALASSTIPWIFKAMQGRYWDGLFSQNPPVRNFVADPGTVEEKPDEIWVVQIYPQEYKEEPRWGDEIFNRRFQLTANLSLNQEIASIDSVNKWLGEGRLSSSRHKPIAVHRIRLNVAVLERQWSLDLASQCNRDPAFQQALADHGSEQAELFLPVRGFVEEVWNQPHSANRKDAAARLCPGIVAESQMLETIEALHGAFKSFRVGVEEMEMKRCERADRDALCGEATLRWTGRGTPKGRSNERVTLQGTGHFKIEAGKITEGTIGKIKVETIRGAEAK
jgi:predicted acylesterase/phospholipase RssA